MTMDELLRRMAKVRREMRRLFLLDGAGRVLLAASAAVLLLFVADFALHLPAGARMVLFLLSSLGIGLALRRYVAGPMRVRISDDAIAARVEAVHPQLRESLISALQFNRRTDEVSRRIMSQDMMRATVDGALVMAAPLSFRAFLRPSRAWRTFALGLVASAGLLAAGASSPGTSSIFLSRVWGGPARWPPRNILVVEAPVSERTRIAAGEDLVVRVRAEKEVPSRVWINYRYAATGEKGEVRMVRLEGNRFEFPFTRVVSPLRFSIEGGDAHTGEYEIEVLEPPRVSSIRVWLTPPAYTKAPPTPEDAPLTEGGINAPSGTKARIRVESSKPLRSASLLFQPSGSFLAMTLSGPLSGEARMDVARNEHYGVKLVDEEGLENRTPSRFTVRAAPDRRPRITVTRPDSTSLWITPSAALSFDFKVDDDYGVNRVTLQVVRSSRENKALELQLEGVSGPAVQYGRPTESYLNVLDFSSLEVPGEDAPRRIKEGDLVLVQAVATDYQEPVQNKASSADYRLTVVSPGKLESIIEERMINVKDILRRAHGEQETVRATLSELQEALASDQVWDTAHREKLIGAQTGQRGVGQRLETAARELERVLQTVQTNRLGDPEYLKKIQEMGQVAAHLAGDRCADALAGMEKARSSPSRRDQSRGLSDAAQVQQDIQRAIADLLERMAKWEDYNEVVKLLREIRETEENLRRDTLGEAEEREKKK